jgi:hypothetical protein
MSLLSFAAGFVSGWLVRSTVESSRGLAVKLVASYQTLAKRAESVLVAEREFLEDLWEEAGTSSAARERERGLTKAKARRSPASQDGAVAS